MQVFLGKKKFDFSTQCIVCGGKLPHPINVTSFSNSKFNKLMDYNGNYSYCDNASCRNIFILCPNDEAIQKIYHQTTGVKPRCKSM